MKTIPSLITTVLLLFSPLLALAQTDKQVWVQRFGGATPSAVAVDSSGNIIVTGGGDDYATIKYSPSGVPLWTNYYDSPVHLVDAASALAVASNGNIFVTGFSYSHDGEDVLPEYLTIAYTGEGVPLWTNRANEGAPVAIAAGGNGDVIVTGSYDVVLGDGVWVTIKYSGAGVPLWTNRYGGSASFAHSLAVDSHGDSVVVGSSNQKFAAIKYSSSGSTLWTSVYSRNAPDYDDPDGLATAVGVWTNGEIFVTGYAVREPIAEGSEYDFVTIKYSASGLPVWTNLYGAEKIGDFAQSLAVDGSGNVVVTGFSQNNASNYLRNFVIIKYSNDGIPLWTNLYAGPGDPRDTPHAVAVDRNGNVFVTGSSFQTHPGDSITIAYSSEGVPLWTNRYHGPAGHYDGGYDLAVTGVGEVVVLGYSFGDYATIKYDSGFALDPPRLSVNGIVMSDNNLILAWPTNFSGFNLESTTNMTPPVTWSEVTNARVIVGGQFTVTNSRSASAQIFRLHKP